MSYFHAVCPWCDQPYTYGIVGSMQIGSGHTCTTDKPCDHDGCDQLGTFYAAPLTAQIIRHDEAVFTCIAHVDDRCILQAQGRAARDTHPPTLR